MICYWETSQRPLIIRTVWVKGHRHAILSETESSKRDRKKKEQEQEQKHKVSDLSPLQLAILPDYSNVSNRVQQQNASKVTYVNKIMNVNLKNKTDQSEPNPLSERVLQWLDLAGQSTVKYKYIEEPKLAMVRHSLPEVKVSQNELKLLKTDIEFNQDDCNCENNQKSSRYQQNGDVYNDVDCENFHCEVVNVNDETSKSQNVTDSSSVSNMTDNSSYNSDDEDFSIEDEIIVTKNKSRENFEFERDYISIIKKQIFESNCNTFVARKKLHIFIPSMPKKTASSIGNESNPSVYSKKNVS